MPNNLQYETHELAQLIGQGHQPAFQQCFEDNYTKLCFFAQRITDNLAEAEDIVQEVFFRLWKNRSKLRDQGNLRSLLYTMVKNACLDHLRQLKTRTARQEELQYLTEQDTHFLEATVLQEELLQLLLKAIETLPEKYRRIISMIYLEDLSYAEISTQLQLPEPTIRKQKERALRMLNKVILTGNQLPICIITSHLFFLAAFVTKS